MNDDETLDVLSEFGLRTGEVLSRSEVHRLGKHHRAVHLYIINSAGDLLIQKRSSSVDHLPGAFGISVTGHIDSGECSSDAVRREAKEELGIDGKTIKIEFLFSHFQEVFLGETYIDRQFNDVYVSFADIDPGLIHFDEAEVMEVKFVPFVEFRNMVVDECSNLAPVYANEIADLIYFLRNKGFAI